MPKDSNIIQFKDEVNLINWTHIFLFYLIFLWTDNRQKSSLHHLYTFCFSSFTCTFMHLTSGVTHHPPHWSCRTCWQKSFLAFSEALNSMTQSSTAGLQSAQSVLCDLQHSCIWLQCLCFCVWLCFAHIAQYFSKHCACDLKLMEIVLPHRFVFFCLHVFSSVAVRWSSGHCNC